MTRAERDRRNVGTVRVDHTALAAMRSRRALWRSRARCFYAEAGGRRPTGPTGAAATRNTPVPAKAVEDSVSACSMEAPKGVAAVLCDGFDEKLVTELDLNTTRITAPDNAQLDCWLVTSSLDVIIP